MEKTIFIEVQYPRDYRLRLRNAILYSANLFGNPEDLKIEDAKKSVLASSKDRGVFKVTLKSFPSAAYSGAFRFARAMEFWASHSGVDILICSRVGDDAYV